MKNILKKTLLFFLAAAVIAGCTGCGKSPSGNSEAGASGQTSTETRPEKYSQDE